MTKTIIVNKGRVRQIFLTKLVPGQVACKNHMPRRISYLSNISLQFKILFTDVCKTKLKNEKSDKRTIANQNILNTVSLSKKAFVKYS